MKQLADNITAIAAIIAVGWGAFIYFNDIRYMVGNVAVRNISWAASKVCENPADQMMWEYLQEEMQRYERYMGRKHRFAAGGFCE